MLKHIPNVLTVTRILLVPVFFVMLMANPTHASWRLWATVIFGVAIATDFLDGKIARKYDLVSNFGKIWDPLADKVLTGMAFIGLSILGELWWWVTIVVLIREIGITVLREWLVKKNIIMPANRGGKLKTLTQSIALLIFLPGLAHLPDWLGWIGIAVMSLAVGLTIVSGVVYVFEAKAEVRKVAVNG